MNTALGMFGQELKGGKRVQVRKKRLPHLKKHGRSRSDTNGSRPATSGMLTRPKTHEGDSETLVEARTQLTSAVSSSSKKSLKYSSSHFPSRPQTAVSFAPDIPISGADSAPTQRTQRTDGVRTHSPQGMQKPQRTSEEPQRASTEQTGGKVLKNSKSAPAFGVGTERHGGKLSANSKAAPGRHRLVPPLQVFKLTSQPPASQFFSGDATRRAASKHSRPGTAVDATGGRTRPPSAHQHLQMGNYSIGLTKRSTQLAMNLEQAIAASLQS